MRRVRPGSLITPTWRTGRPARATAGVAATAAAALLLTGCHVPGMSAATPTPSATLTVAATPGVADAPAYIASQQGLFRKAGVNVRFRSYPTLQDEIAALQNGSADIAFGGYASLFYAQAEATVQSKNLDVTIVAEGYDAGPNVMEVLTLPNSRIVNPTDLKGATIGTAAPQNMPDHTNTPHQQYSPGQPFSMATLATTSVLGNDEVRATSIHWRPMAEDKLVHALGSGHVQAIVATEPTIYLAETEYGAVPVIDSCTGATASLPLDGYFALHSFVTGHGTALSAFRSALRQAQADAAQPGMVQSALKSAAKMPSAEANLVTLGTYPTTTSLHDLQRIVTLMAYYNMLPPGQPVVSRMLDP